MDQEINIETILQHLDRLTPTSSPKWGSMNAQQMVEHLTDVLRIATGETKLELLVPEDKLEKMQAFLYSDKPMAQNIEVPFAPKNPPLRNEELELAIDELVDVYLHFEELFENNPDLKTLHPYYGLLNAEGWQKLNHKHFTHHFTQFGLI